MIIKSSPHSGITVVIPVYNEANHLRDCLDSLSNQSLRPLEVLVIDNNSSDESVGIAKSYPFVKVMNESRQGVVFARNRGLDNAKGEIIARVDADSILPINWLEIVHEAFANSQDIAALTGSPLFNDLWFSRLFDWLQVVAYQYAQRLLTGTYFLWGANMAIRASSWETVRDSCSVRTDIDEDIDLSFVLHEAGHKIDFAPSIKVQASFRRGKYQFPSVMKYLMTWPRDYILHKHYLGAGIVGIFCVVIIAVTAPYTIGYWIFTGLRR